MKNVKYTYSLYKSEIIVIFSILFVSIPSLIKNDLSLIISSLLLVLLIGYGLLKKHFSPILIPAILCIIAICCLRLVTINIFQTFSFFVYFISLILSVISIFSKKIRFVFFNLAFLFFSIGIGEFYLLSKESNVVYSGDTFRADLPPQFTDQSTIVGFKPKKNVRTMVSSFLNGKAIDSCLMQTDSNGLRKIKPYNWNDETPDILFFGCSFTFGYGITDTATSPSLIQDKLQDQYRLYNMGMSGWGTHQMLSLVENNCIDTMIVGKPKHVFYFAIEDHINRILALQFWNKMSSEPRYIYDEKNKTVIRQGYSTDLDGFFIRLMHNSQKSQTIQTYINKLPKSKLLGLFEKRAADTSDIKLFIGMIKKTEYLLHKKYPNVIFHVIFWDNYAPMENEIKLAFLAANLDVHYISKIIPDYMTNGDSYGIAPPYDYHPNYKQNKKIAKYVVDSIINKQ